MSDTVTEYRSVTALPGSNLYPLTPGKFAPTNP